jgi:hypothetical protein
MIVDIRSIAGSSHPSCRGQKNEGEAISHSRAGQSHQAGGNATSTVVAATTATTHRQPSTTTVVVTPLAAPPEPSRVGHLTEGSEAVVQ